MAPPLLHFRRLHPHCLLLPRLRRSVLRLSLKPLCSSSSSSDYSPPALHGPSLCRGRAPPTDHTDDPFARSFDLAALRVPAAACAPLERRLRGHLLNWPRVRNVAHLPNDDQGLLGLALPSLPPRWRLSAEEFGTPPTTTAAVARRDKLAREFNARGFARFPNLARISRPRPRPRPSPAAQKRRERRAGGGSDEEATGRRRDIDKDKVYVVEVVGEGRDGDEDELKGLVGEEECLRRGAWRTGPCRLLLLDEKYAGRGVDELPEAVKEVVHIKDEIDNLVPTSTPDFGVVVLDHESHHNGSSAYELVHCRLTLFYNYWADA